MTLLATMRYLSKNELLDLHAYVLDRYGGRMGINSQDRLVTALVAPQQVMFGAELHTDVPSKAAALMFSLLKSRPFVSGNEVTALLALLRFLELNDYHLDEKLSDAELVRVVRAVSRSEMDKDALEQWIRERLIPSA